MLMEAKGWRRIRRYEQVEGNGPRFMALHELDSLGGMVASGSLILARASWLAIYPGVVLTALASSLILIGYGTLGLVRSRPTPTSLPAERLAEA